MNHLNTEQLKQKLDYIRQSPKDGGVLEMIVRRPDVDERVELEEAELNPEVGLVGDSWIKRGSSKTPDGSSHPGMQVTLMNSRCVEVLSGSRDRWQLAGDQLFIDMDLSEDNLPPGTRLSIGSAEIEVSSIPHNGCMKFAARFGKDAVHFVNSKIGKQLHLRGLNARVVQKGRINRGDRVYIIT